MAAYPQPKVMKSPGRSLSRSSLLVRARQRGIKPESREKEHTHANTTPFSIVTTVSEPLPRIPAQMYVLYREP